ncbi:S-methyl-5-thioadenosine phosphorylase [Coemansia sp. RSA 988]|nr:S-methyl-5-thioadenosine phosphorylase [Coemansia sp. RSA 988]
MFYLDNGDVDYNMKSPSGPIVGYPCRDFKANPTLGTSLTTMASMFAVIWDKLTSCFLDTTNSGYDVPDTIPAAKKKAMFAWTWINGMGSRKYYMNCADVCIENYGHQELLTAHGLLVINLPGKTTVIPKTGREEEGLISLLKQRPFVAIGKPHDLAQKEQSSRGNSARWKTISRAPSLEVYLTVHSTNGNSGAYLSGNVKSHLRAGAPIPFDIDDALLETHHLASNDNFDLWPSSTASTLALEIDAPGASTQVSAPLDLGIAQRFTQAASSADVLVTRFKTVAVDNTPFLRVVYLSNNTAVLSSPMIAYTSQDVRIGVIGGTGLYSLDGLKVVETVAVETPWGQPSGPVTIAESQRGHKIAFLARHGPAHHVLPSEVNYRANIAALKALGVQVILGFSAVGSLREEIQPGDFVLVDQVIDRTKGKRADSFFTGTGVTAHASFGEPFSAALRALVAQHGDAVPAITIHPTGTGVCMEGPAFSTRAESNLYRAWGADIINMTIIPESKLAREAEITYATVCMATDYDAWRETEEPVTVAEVMKTMKVNAANAKVLLLAALPALEHAVYSDTEQALTKPEAGSMQYAFQQPPEMQALATGRDALRFIFPEYFKTK